MEGRGKEEKEKKEKNMLISLNLLEEKLNGFNLFNFNHKLIYSMQYILNYWDKEAKKKPAMAQ